MVWPPSSSRGGRGNSTAKLFNRDSHNKCRVSSMRVIIRSLVLLSLLAPALAQVSTWNEPFPAHRVMDNVYYVGTRELASYLITTPEGHILMNSNYEASVPVIQASVKELGFEFKD